LDTRIKLSKLSERHYKTPLLRLATFALVAASSLSANVLTGVTATTDMGAASGTVISQIVDGSGLSSYDPSATHDNGSPSNAWVGDLSTGMITFDLGGSFELDGMAVWNFNALSAFGVQDVTVSSSLDGISFTPISGAPSTFSIGSNLSSESAETFQFSATAAFVRFDIASNYGGANTALSEVMFTGAPSAVPEPQTYALFLTGLAAFVYKRRSHKV